jgi:hypothetical protein
VATTPAPSASDRPVAAREQGRTLHPAASTPIILTPRLLLVASRYFTASTDPDYWWHVRTGQLILEQSALPRVDDYSFTVTGRPWVTHEWLSEVIFFAVQERFGYVGNVALFGLVGALTALAVYAVCHLRGLGQPAAVLLMVWASALGMGSANVRPQAFTALALAILLWLLSRYKLCGERRALWGVPPLLALWVNLHGGYVIGLVVLGLACLGETTALLLRRPAAPLRPLVVTCVLATLASLVSPHGFEALTYPLSYAGEGNAMMRFIAEWQSPNFHVSYLLVFAASLLLAVWLGLGRQPLGPTELLWGLCFALLGLRSVRHIALYGVVVIPLIGARLQAEVPALRLSLARWQRPRLLLAAVWLLAAVAAVKLVTGGAGELQLGREPAERGHPVGAVQYLRAHDLPGNLYNNYAWGGYLIHELYPERRVFIDGRTDVYAEFMGRYMEVERLAPGWRQVLDDHDVRIVLVERDEPLAVVLADDPAWQLAYTGSVERLFVRR